MIEFARSISLNSNTYGTHFLRNTKVTLIYRRTRTHRTVQLLLCHNNLDSTVGYPGIKIATAGNVVAD